MLLNSANSSWLVHISACFYYVCTEPQTRLRNKHPVLGFWSLDRSLSNRKLSFFSLVYASCFWEHKCGEFTCLGLTFYNIHICVRTGVTAGAIFICRPGFAGFICSSQKPCSSCSFLSCCYLWHLTSVVNLIIYFFMIIDSLHLCSPVLMLFCFVFFGILQTKSR